MKINPSPKFAIACGVGTLVFVAGSTVARATFPQLLTQVSQGFKPASEPNPTTLVAQHSSDRTDKVPTIQIAILLDSSNSMDGLIDQARTQIWEVVNALTKVRKNGQIPRLEVALYHYGNDSLPSSEGYNRLLNQFTPELDLVSEQLFGIRTNGGQEYAGWVMRSAMAELDWDDDPQNFRGIFIAGNEPFSQGAVPWPQAIAQAVNKDTVVNTIYCGGAESNERQEWAAGALRGKGEHFNLDHNRTVVYIPSPFDPEIEALNQKLNDTYIPYGTEGAAGLSRQAEADMEVGAQAPTRAISKASDFYSNTSWDLVDAVEEEVVALDRLEPEALPAPMQSMSVAEREDYVASMQTQRTEIRQQLQALAEQREEYLRSLPHNQGEATLDQLMIAALRKQLAAKGFEFGE